MVGVVLASLGVVGYSCWGLKRFGVGDAFGKFFDLGGRPRFRRGATGVSVVAALRGRRPVNWKAARPASVWYASSLRFVALRVRASSHPRGGCIC